MTPSQLATEEAKAAALTVATHAMVRAMPARDTWTMARILDRWATGPGTEGMDFAAAVAGAGAALGTGEHVLAGVHLYRVDKPSDLIRRHAAKLEQSVAHRLAS